jgi:hypothetical protein
MNVEVADVHVDGLRSASEYLRARHALVRPDGSEHDDVRAEPQLRMTDERTDSGTENSSTKPKVAQSDRIASRASLYRRMGKRVCMSPCDRPD